MTMQAGDLLVSARADMTGALKGLSDLEAAVTKSEKTLGDKGQVMGKAVGEGMTKGLSGEQGRVRTILKDMAGLSDYNAEASFSEKGAVIGGALGRGVSKGLAIGLGDVGALVDTATNLFAAGLAAIPQVGLGMSAAFKEMSGALTDATARGFLYNDNLRKQQIQLGLVSESADEAKQKLKALGDITNSTGIKRGFLVDSLQQLEMFGIKTERAENLIRGLAKHATAFGHDDISGATALISRMMETGKVDGRMIKAFAGQQIDLNAAVSSELGISREAAHDALMKGVLSPKNLTAILTDFLNSPKFTQAADAMIRTTQTGQANKYERGVNRILGSATEDAYNASIAGYQAANAAVQSPLAGSMAAKAELALSPVTNSIEAMLKSVQGGDVFGGALKIGQGIIDGVDKGIRSSDNTLIKGGVEVLDKFDTGLRDFLGMHSPADFTVPVGEGLMLGIGKGFAGALDNTEKQYLQPAVEALRARLEKLLNDPHMQAMLEVIKKSEVGNDKNPYGRAFGHGGHIDPNTLKADGSNWYGERVFSPSLHRSVMTHAFGAYQAEPGTYRDFSRKTGVTDVSPHSQDLFAVHDIMSKYPKALQMILEGNAQGAMSALKKEWESFAVNPASKRASLVSGFDSFIASGKAMNVRIVEAVVGGDMGAPTAADNAYMRNKMLVRPHKREDSGPAAKAIGDMYDESGKLIGVWHEVEQTIHDTGQMVINVKGGFTELVTEGKMLGAEFLNLKPTVLEVEAAVENTGQKLYTAAEKGKGNIKGLGADLREMGFTSAGLSKTFESSFMNAIGHTREGIKGMARTFALDMINAILQVEEKWLAAKFASALFGSGKTDENGKTKGGLLSGIFGKIVGAVIGGALGGGHIGGFTGGGGTGMNFGSVNSSGFMSAGAINNFFSGGHAKGGYISGEGSGTSDSIASMLSNGEYVVKAAAVSSYGRENLDAINSGQQIASIAPPPAPITIHVTNNFQAHPQTGAFAPQSAHQAASTVLAQLNKAQRRK